MNALIDLINLMVFLFFKKSNMIVTNDTIE